MALPTQQYSNLLDMFLNNSDWATDWNQNVAILKNVFRTFKITITVQGSHLSPSTVTIQLQDALGTTNIAEQFFLRVRVCDGTTGYANATNAQIAATGTSSTFIAFFVNKDLLIQSDATGLITLTCTDATIETFLLRLGQPEVMGEFVNVNNTQAVVHA